MISYIHYCILYYIHTTIYTKSYIHYNYIIYYILYSIHYYELYHIHTLHYTLYIYIYNKGERPPPQLYSAPDIEDDPEAMRAVEHLATYALRTKTVIATGIYVYVFIYCVYYIRICVCII